MKKRTDIDFSKHTLTVTKAPGYMVYDFGKPGSSCNRIKFINTSGIMAVTGDFGNWIFCREFHPSEDGRVSDQYWCEKLKIASVQEPYEYDEDGTHKRLLTELKEEEELTEEEKEYLEECLRLTDMEFDYDAYAYRQGVGRYEDSESIIKVRRVKIWLQYIFDGFDEICSRLKEQSANQLPHPEAQKTA